MNDPEKKSLEIPDPNAEVPQLAAEHSAYGFTPPGFPGDIGQFGPYRILQVLGRGGLGAVFLALDSRLERRVAIKILRPELVRDVTTHKRFLRELRAVAGIHHDHVIPIYEADVRNGILYYVMPYLRGRSLADSLAESLHHKTLSIPQSIRVVREIAFGLAALHNHGVIHRDIKPSNIWLESPNGRVTILDIGLASLMNNDVSDSRLTMSGAFVGTPAYTSPELLNDQPLDSRSDLFSLGCTLYQMLCGKTPFARPSLNQTLMALIAEEPTAIQRLNPAVPNALAELVHQLLEKQPTNRPTAIEVANRLGNLSQQLEITPSTPQVAPRPVASDTAVSAALGSIDQPVPPVPSVAGVKRTDSSDPRTIPRDKAARFDSPLAGALGVFTGIMSMPVAGVTGVLGRLFGSRQPPPPPPTAGDQPYGKDRVHFSVTSPSVVQPGSVFLLNVWAHLGAQRPEVRRLAEEQLGGKSMSLVSQGPVLLARGVVLSVTVRIDGLNIPDPENSIHWTGEIGNATFTIEVPPGTEPGGRNGRVFVWADGLRIAQLSFVLLVGDSTSSPQPLEIREERCRKAFASYAHEDRNAVIARVQGILKVTPDLDIFLDVISLRPGEKWEERLWQVIPTSDVFYLFWSHHAKASEWVEREWRCALATRGLDFIDPVPLVPPDVAPPPHELSSKNFNDWVLAFMRKPVAN